MGSYNATYQFFVKPTQEEQYWSQTNYDKPTPPPIKRFPGRPKKTKEERWQ
ncbi:hypothetical protein SESBI_48637 [Sesbania bispinosa]|nr:hypothetical protein SESBI_48637 [Sesbania bispinosa]